MKFIDWFAGVGGFRRGMELAGHECVGFCEYDKYAIASYTSMHLITDEQREYLSTLPLRKRQEEILKEEYRNGEWFARDIRTVDPGDVPRADIYCFGAPCQDFSVAGLRKGMEGQRSVLVREVFRIIEQVPEGLRPTWLVYENVKGMLSSNRGKDFLAILTEMDELGYDAEWQVLNSKYFSVPQNRERVYTVGHFRGRGGQKVFPVQGTDGADNVGIVRIGHANNFRRYNQTYDPSGIVEAMDTGSGGGHNPFVVMREDAGPDTIYYPKEDCYVSIRKLTPRECFRLQGWSDEFFERAEFVNSDSQLYKQAGNGVTVNVVYEIGRKIHE